MCIKAKRKLLTMTSDQKRSYIQKHFLSPLKGLQYQQKGNYLIKAPIGDLLRGFCFNWPGDAVYVHWFFMPLIVPAGHIYLSYGGRLSAGKPVWDRFKMDNGHLAISTSLINQLIEKQGPVIEATKTLNGFLDKFFKEEKDDVRWLEMKAYLHCYLSKSDCTSIIDGFLVYWDKSDRKGLNWMQDMRANMLNLREASEHGRDKVERLFASWKQETISNLKLEKFVK